MALSTNLVSYWKLNESSGNATDSVGVNTLTNTGTVTYGAGLISNCATFASGKYLSVADASQTGLNFTTALTFSVWVYIDTAITDGNRYGLITKTYNAENRGYEFFYARNGSNYRIYVYLGSSNSNWVLPAITSTNLGTAAWHHIVFRYDGSLSGDARFKYTVDNVAKTLESVATLGSFTGTIDASSLEFILGHRTTSIQPLLGKLDEVGVWSRALTDAEITTLYNAGAGLTYPFGATNTTNFFF